MTLNEFSDMCMSAGSKPCEIMVTDDANINDLDNIDEFELLFTLKGGYNAKYYLQDKFTNAEVQEVYAVGRNKFLVCIAFEC